MKNFSTLIKVCFSDIDNAGIVYYPRFLHYFHLAKEEFFAHALGIDYADVLYKKKVTFPSVHIECDFRQKLRYGDKIDMEVSVIKIGNTSITWGYRGFRQGSGKGLVVEGLNTTVCVKPDTFKKIEVPKWLRKGLSEYMRIS